MADIDQYILDDSDIAFEYELQKSPSVEVWQRYIAHWEAQVCEDGVRSARHILWLYERMVTQFPTLTVWEQYIGWFRRQYKLDQYLDTFKLYERCINSVKGPLGVFAVEVMLFCISTFDLDIIMKGLQLVLHRCNKDEVERIWNIVLGFALEHVLPSEEGPNNIDFSAFNDRNYEDLRLDIYKLLFLGGDQTEIEEDEEDEDVDKWTASLLRYYLQVANEDKYDETLRLLIRTKDIKIIKECFDLYIFNDKTGKNNRESKKEYDFDLYIYYLDTLDKLRLDKDYKSVFDNLLEKYPQHRVLLTLKLADFHMKRADFDKMEKVLTKALSETVKTNEFIAIYTYHVNFEQAYVETIFDEMRDDPEIQVQKKWKSEMDDHLIILGDLTSRYHLLVNDLKIRQNPNSVSNWLERTTLFEDFDKKCEVFVEAIKTIDPIKVKDKEYGMLGKLWCDYAKVYWSNKSYEEARTIYESATKVPFPDLQDLEIVWHTWAVNEFQIHNIERALKILRKALTVPPSYESIIDRFKSENRRLPSQTILFTSKRLWNYYIDLLESIPTIDANDVIRAYDTLMTLKLITPVGILNYATFLKQNNNLHGSLQVYEKGINMFPPEICYELWTLLLDEVMEPAHQATKERIRELFEQCLQQLGNTDININSIYVKYSDFEIHNKLFSRAIDILMSGARRPYTNKEQLKQRVDLWESAISKCEEFLGPDSLRQLLSECIQELPNSKAITYVLKFTKLEMSLSDYTRARELLQYGAQLLPPIKNEELWGLWEQFELEHGDKSYYKEMLLLKQKLEKDMKVDTEEVSKGQGSVQFVASSVKNQEAKTNPDEIEIDI